VKYGSLSPEASVQINLYSNGVDLIFNPSTIWFTPAAPTSSFTILSYDPEYGVTIGFTDYTPLPGNNYGGYYEYSTTLIVYGADSTDGSEYEIPLTQYVGVTIVPGSFVLKHPRYQMSEKTHVVVEISNLPRSDVVLTFISNNMKFEPAYVVFVADDVTTKHVVVTPLGTTSYELKYASFHVDYQLSGTNAGDYITPSETYHYIAIPQGYIAAIVLAPIAGIALIARIVILISRRSERTTPSVGGSIQVGI